MSADGNPVELSRREFDLLLLLARDFGKTLSSQHILSQVWGPEWAANLKTLRRHVATLRAKLEDSSGTPRIVTEARHGYRMVGPD